MTRPPTTGPEKTAGQRAYEEATQRAGLWPHGSLAWVQLDSTVRAQWEAAYPQAAQGPTAPEVIGEACMTCGGYRVSGTGDRYVTAKIGSSTVIEEPSPDKVQLAATEIIRAVRAGEADPRKAAVELGLPFDQDKIMSIIERAAGTQEPRPAPSGLAEHLPSADWLRAKVATTPDLDCEAGSLTEPLPYSAPGGLLASIDAAIDGLAPLTGYGEDAVWRPANKAWEALCNAKAALSAPSHTAPTVSGEAEKSRAELEKWIATFVDLAISDGEYLGRHGKAMLPRDVLEARERCRVARRTSILALFPASGLGVAEGWRLVPSAATNNMMNAGVEAGRTELPDLEGRLGFVQARAVWDAMLAAAPNPDTAEEG